MTIESLEFFYAIAEGSTFNNVAKDYNMTQSALSKSIKRLEDELGFDLFDRSGRTVRLSPAGQCIFEDLKKLMPDYKVMRQHINYMSGNKRIVCQLALPGSALGIRNILELFNEEHPEILFSFLQMQKDQCLYFLDDLKNEKTDFVIMHEGLLQQNFYNFTFLHDDYLLIILPVGHTLAAKEMIKLEDLRDEVLLLNDWSSQIMNELSAFSGIKPVNTKISNMTREDLVWNVSKGNGIAIFYASDLNTIKMHNVVIRRFEDIPHQSVILAELQNIEMTLGHYLFKKYLIDAINRNI